MKIKIFSLLTVLVISLTQCNTLNKTIGNNGGGNPKPNGGGANQGGGNSGDDEDMGGGVTPKDYTIEVYAKNVTNWMDNKQDLSINIFKPQNNTGKLPCVINVHGGGFAGGNKDRMNKFAKGFKDANMVAVSVQYRLGFPNANLLVKCGAKPEDFEDASYKAIQDIRGAIRYIMHNADRLGIDKNKIYIGGASAGAVGSMGVAFLDDSEVPSRLKTKFGGLDASGDFQEEKIKIKGAYCFSGGYSSINIFNNNVPVFFVHGNCDGVISPDVATAYFCDASKGYPTGYGGNAIYEHLRKNNICSSGIIYCGGGHVGKSASAGDILPDITKFFQEIEKGNCPTERITRQAIKNNCSNTYNLCK
jgi:Carboxylesterase family